MKEIDCNWLFWEESEGEEMQSEKVGVRRAAPHLESQYRRKDTLEDASTRLANQTTVLKDLTQPNTDRREIRI